MKQYASILINMLLGFVFMETEASAYLDPGTGSFALQIIAASVVAVGFFARKYWSWITSFFSRNSPNSDDGKKQ